MKLLIATRNQHKVEEIKTILGPRIEYFTLTDLPNSPNVVEDAPDFAGNATKKSVSLANWLAALGNPKQIDYVLADDSGLEVDPLNSAPGVHSARFAALDTGSPNNSPDSENNAKLLRLLKNISPEKRTARFRCVIAFTSVPEAQTEVASKTCDANEAELATETFDGACEGKIIDIPRGAHGFGYDPLFVPNGFSETFAELGDSTKNRISHRSAALAKLRARLVKSNR
jgi:XTP/dITP diphosphohydrolase